MPENKDRRLYTRRNIIKGLAGLAGATVLAACAPRQAAPATTSKPAQAPTTAAPAPARREPTKITLWSSFRGANGEAETALVDNFNESQGDIIVDYQFQGSYEETAQKLTAAIQARTIPEISLLSDVWWFKFYLNRAIAPLDDLMVQANMDVSDYQDSLINEGLRRGVHYWVPFARSTPLFYYNKPLWAEAGLPDRGPETWAEFMEWAPKLVKHEGSEMRTAAFSHPDGASYIAWLFQGVAWQFGGKYSDPDFTMHMTDEDTLRAGQFYHDTVHADKWARPSKDLGADFVNGLTAAAMMSTGSMGGIRNNAQFEFGTAFLPREREFGCCTGGAGLAVLSATPTDKQIAAMQYIAYATNPENQTFWCKATGYMPVRKSSLESAEMQAFFAEFPQFRTAAEQLELTQAQDSARVFVPNGDQIIGKGLERITVQNESVASAFGDVQRVLVEEAKPVIEAVRAIEG